MRQLREPDAFPAADIGLMRAMADADGVRPNAAALLARAEQWRPWRAYAAQHLWQAPARPVEKESLPRKRRLPNAPGLIEGASSSPPLRDVIV